MSKPSLLAQTMLEPMLKTARKNLECEGYLIPFLFAQLSVAGLRLVPLDLPQNGEQKRRYITGLGSLFRRRKQIVMAAVIVSDSWFVAAQKTPAALTIPPSKHPSRQEAITLIGRDAQNARATHVVQPYVRDACNRPVWSEPAIALYDEPVQAAGQFDDLLDYLFLANRKGVK